MAQCDVNEYSVKSIWQTKEIINISINMRRWRRMCGKRNREMDIDVDVDVHATLNTLVFKHTLKYNCICMVYGKGDLGLRFCMFPTLIKHAAYSEVSNWEKTAYYLFISMQ